MLLIRGLVLAIAHNSGTYEAAGAAEELLRGYDRASGRWAFPRTGPFWDAVGLAHRRGVRGQGRTIAVIDGAFDLSIPALELRTRSHFARSSALESTAHGTAVALLVATVAPGARLDLYEVGRGGEPDVKAVIASIDQAGASDADVITLSLGFRKDASRELAAYSAQFTSLDDVVRSAINNPTNKPLGTDSCDVCQAAQTARRRGRVIVAAAGNDAEALLCPARSDDVISCGFRREQRETKSLSAGVLAEVAVVRDPTYSQSLWVDTTIMQPDGVLGSSFAAPLVAGFAALSNEGTRLYSHVGVMTPSALADGLAASVFGSQATREDVERILRLYDEALKRRVHKHEAPGDGDPCLECGVMCESLYVNGGRFMLAVGNLELAERLLRVAHWFAPWSPHAAANLGRTLQARADESGDPRSLPEALAMYDAALKLRPGFNVYTEQRAIIAQKIHQGGLTNL